MSDETRDWPETLTTPRGLVLSREEGEITWYRASIGAISAFASGDLSHGWASIFGEIYNSDLLTRAAALAWIDARLIETLAALNAVLDPPDDEDLVLLIPCADCGWIDDCTHAAKRDEADHEYDARGDR